MERETVVFVRAMLGADTDLVLRAADVVLAAEPGKPLRLTAAELTALNRCVAVAMRIRADAAFEAHELSDAHVPLTERAPALAAWRRAVLATPRRSALERAAALELTALDAIDTGDMEAARAAWAEAERLVMRRAQAREREREKMQGAA